MRVLPLLRILVAVAGAFLLSERRAAAALTQELGTLTITNYTGFIIASDSLNAAAGYNRDYVGVRLPITYARSGASGYKGDYRIRFRLLDENGVAQELRLTGNTTGTQLDVDDAVDLTAGASPRVEVYTAALRPANKLDPYKEYRVRATLLYRLTVGGNYIPTSDAPKDTALQRFIHFPSLIANDASLNVVPYLEGGIYHRAYLVASDPEKFTFQVRPSGRLYRYDDFDSPQNSTTVKLRFGIALFEAGNNAPIPLQDSTVDVNVTAVDTHNGQAVRAPENKVLSNIVLDFRPALGVQLNPVGKLYYVRLTVGHFDTPNAALPIAGNNVTLPDQRFLHFNGNLFFGGKTGLRTLVTSIANNPAPGAVNLLTGVASTLAVDGGGGIVPGHDGYFFGDGTPLPVLLQSNGDALFTGNGKVNVDGPDPDTGESAGIRFERKNVQFTETGAIATICLTLPAGLGTRADTNGKVMDSEVCLDGVALDNQLGIKAASISGGGVRWYSEETKPFWFQAASTTWLVNEGRLSIATTGQARYVRATEMDALAVVPVDNPAYRTKRSNELLWRAVQNVAGAVIVRLDANGGAQLDADVGIGPGNFLTHFPYESTVSWTGGSSLRIEHDRIVAAESMLEAANNVLVRYTTDCRDEGCGDSGPDPLIGFAPASARLTITAEGGVHAAGNTVGAVELQWGYIPSLGKFAHRTSAFTQADYFMAGTFVVGGTTQLASEDRPGFLLLSGILPGNLETFERPRSTAYEEGLADYAGLNFRTVANNAKQAESVLGGKPTGEYQLTGRCKYYVRRGGVSGIHEAVNGSFPATAVICGYNFNFSTFGLAFLDSRNETDAGPLPSRTAGAVKVAYPSNIELPFERLQFSCLGALTDMQLPADQLQVARNLQYWNADFFARSMRFDGKKSDQCNPSKRVLTVAVDAHASHLLEPIHGTLGFKPTGQIISLADNQAADGPLDPPFDSRLVLPTQFEFGGPGSGDKQEKYRLTPVNRAYLSSYDANKLGTGFMNIAGKLDVTFFEDMQVHLHTGAKTNDTAAAIHLMGGWPDHGFGGADHNFFTEAVADPGNVGFPQGVTVDQYRAGKGEPETYRPRARQVFAGVLPLDYPLEWTAGTKEFKSTEPKENNLLVIRTKHQVKRLTPRRGEITFGASFEAIPIVNLAGLAIDQLEEQEDIFAGLLSTAIVTAATDGLNDLLSEQQQALFGPLFAQRIGPVLTNLYNELKANYDVPTRTWKQAPAPIIQARIVGNPGDTDTVLFHLRDLLLQDGSVVSVLGEANKKIDAAIDALDKVSKYLEYGQSGTREKYLESARKAVQKAAEAIKSPTLAADFEELLQETVVRAEPALDELSYVIEQLQTLLAGAKNDLKKGGSIATQIKSEIEKVDNLLKDAVQAASDDLKLWAVNVHTGVDNPFADPAKPALLQQWMTRVEDRFFGSAVSAVTKRVLKQRFADLDAAIRSTIDDIFGELNGVVEELLSQVVSGVEDKFNEFLGDAGASMAGSKIKGHAHIKDDSLSELRIDLSLKLKAPDEMTFNAFIQIKELDSENTPAGCLPKGGLATEVIVGAKDVSLEWAYKGLRLNIQSKFVFNGGIGDPGNDPNQEAGKLFGMGGGIELAGELKFSKQFIIKELGCAIAFGAVENYFSAEAAMEFGKGYKAKGGMMFGRTCTLDPFFWDKEVQSVLGEPPFTGAYAYAEAWVPLNDLFGIKSTCFFTVSAGVGAGAGFFVEGPTFIGKMFFGVSGQVLCLVNITGEITLVGVVSPGSLKLKGTGHVEGDIGYCPICIPFDKTIGLTYDDGKWDLSL